MPKRVGHLYERMLDKNQIRDSIKNCAKHKLNRKEVKEVLKELDKHVDILYDILLKDSYVTPTPKRRTIIDSSSRKQREISVIPFFPDSCLQRLATDIMRQDVLMKHMYYYSCASIPGRGNKHAQKYVKRALRNKRCSKYYVKLDIKKYYPSLKVGVVLDKLSRKIKDYKFIDLIERMISVEDNGGMSIGFYINQWLANFVLEDLDWKIAGFDGTGYYVRNMDDMIIIGSNKRKLYKVIEMIKNELETMNLVLKPNAYVRKVDESGIDFVGMRFCHGYTELRKRNNKKLRRRLLRTKHKIKENKEICFTLASGLLSQIGNLKYTDSYNFSNKYVKLINIILLKDIVSGRICFNGFDKQIMECNKQALPDC